MTFSQIGCTHLRYHKWATERILAESLELPAEDLAKDLKVSFGSIYGTITHLYQADAIWLDRLTGVPKGRRDEYEAPGCTFELRDAWLPLLDRMIAFAEGLKEEEWQREIAYNTFAGTPYESALWEVVLHVVNHGTYHRGQVTAMLRQVGAKPSNLDLIAYYRMTNDN